MFGNHNGQSPSSPPPSPDEQGDDQPEQPRRFRMPNLTTWRITYGNDLQSSVVTGHGMTLSENGALTIQTFKLDPAFGPTPVPTWGRSSYVSFEDITPVPAEPSVLIH